MNNELDKAAATSAALVLHTMSGEAVKLAGELSVPETLAFEALADHVRKQLTPRALEDKRTRPFRARIRLYCNGADEPDADTDMELPADKPGTLVLRGLPAVAAELAALCAHFHGQACAGLDAATLRWRLNGLRPTLSRRGGNGVWRVPYDVAIGKETQPWLARVDLVREQETDNEHTSTVT